MFRFPAQINSSLEGQFHLGSNRDMGVMLAGYRPQVRCDAPKLAPAVDSCFVLLEEMVASKQPLKFGSKGMPGIDVELPYYINSS